MNASEKKNSGGGGKYPPILSCSRFKFQYSLFNTILLNTLTSKILSLVYIKLDLMHAWHSHISDLHIIISMLMECWTIWKKKRRDKIHCKLMYNILVYNKYLHVQLFYPQQTKFGGVYRNHPVRPSMYIVPCKHNSS